MVAAAIGVGAAGVVGSSLFSGFEQAGAASKASQEQQAAIKQAEGQVQNYFNTGESNLQPFQQEGVQAGGQLSSLLGLNGGSAQAQNTLQNLPGYQFALGQGQQAQAASITARGLGLSGAQLRGASDYAQGAASQNYMQYAQQLYNLTGLGESAGQGIANLAGQTGQSLGNLAVGVGNAQAAGTIGQANAYGSAAQGVGNAFSNAANTYGGYNLYQNLAAANSGAGGQYVGVSDGATPSATTQLNSTFPNLW